MHSLWFLLASLFFIMFSWIPVISWPLSGRAVSAFLDKVLKPTDLKFGGCLTYDTTQGWLTFGLVPWNDHHFLVSGLLSSLYTFTASPLMWVTSNLLDVFLVELPRHDWFPTDILCNSQCSQQIDTSVCSEFFVFTMCRFETILSSPCAW